MGLSVLFPLRHKMTTVADSPTSDIKQKYKQQQGKDVLSVPLNRLPTHATKTMILGYCRLFEKGQINLL